VLYLVGQLLKSFITDARKHEHKIHCLHYSTRHYTDYVTAHQSGSQFTTCFLYVHQSTHTLKTIIFNV